MIKTTKGYLNGLRVLDLTDQRGLAAAHFLARLGADVLQVEPPSGSPARAVPPYSEAESLDRSLYWAAYAAGKRSVSRDIQTDSGREFILSLVRDADFLFESSGPGVLAAIGLGWEALRVVNPQLVYVSIKAYGESGPKVGYADTDLILWAAGGALLGSRDANGTPLCISVPQAYLNAAADAAVGALIAYHARLKNGYGQQVAVSVQTSVAQCTLSGVLSDAVGHRNFDLYSPGAVPTKKKDLDLSGSGARTRKSKWAVIDGLVEFHLGMGPAAGPSTNALWAWMRAEAALDARIADWDWVALPARIASDELSECDLDLARVATGAFLARYTKLELQTQAMQRRILLAPIMTTVDLLNSSQFAARNFLLKLTTAPAGCITLPGNFAQTDAAAFAPLRPAPRLGQHNDEPHWLPTRAPALTRALTPACSPALHGLKVLDLAWVVAGPTVGRVLAEYGADVVRVESRKRFDMARRTGPFLNGHGDPERSAVYDNCNAGKWGLTLDLSLPQAREVIRDLVRWADVVVESFANGQMDKWGLSYAALRRLNPGVVMLSTNLMGATGPLAGVAGFGNVGAAMSGFQQVVGQANALPIGPYGPYTDYVAPRLALIALLAALYERRRTGEGAHLDVSQAEAGIHFLAAELAATALNGIPAAGRGNRDPAMAPHGVFRCKDECWVAIAVRDDREWRILASHLKGHAMMDDAALTTLAGRQQHEDHLEAAISAWTTTRVALEVEQLLQADGIPAHVAVSSAEFCKDPQIQHLGHIIQLPHPHGGTQVIEASRFRLSETPAQIARPAPTFGRDNHHVLKVFAGYDETKIAALKALDIFT